MVVWCCFVVVWKLMCCVVVCWWCDGVVMCIEVRFCVVCVCVFCFMYCVFEMFIKFEMFII